MCPRARRVERAARVEVRETNIVLVRADLNFKMKRISAGDFSLHRHFFAAAFSS